jgi:hypothetical protein
MTADGLHGGLQGKPTRRRFETVQILNRFKNGIIGINPETGTLLKIGRSSWRCSNAAQAVHRQPSSALVAKKTRGEAGAVCCGRSRNPAVAARLSW